MLCAFDINEMLYLLSDYIDYIVLHPTVCECGKIRSHISTLQLFTDLCILLLHVLLASPTCHNTAVSTIEYFVLLMPHQHNVSVSFDDHHYWCYNRN